MSSGRPLGCQWSMHYTGLNFVIIGGEGKVSLETKGIKEKER